MRWRDLKKNQTKQSQPSTQNNRANYATITEKIKAFITDMFMIYIPILYIITYLIMGDKESFQSSQMGPLMGVVIYGLIDAIFISRSGQTPGKKAYNIKVVDVDTLETISFLHALLRYLIFLLTASTIFALLVPYFRKDRRSLHDLLSKTTLISLEK